uniref:HORMA domain-containing protein n=1 Tax=Steinernema glaseri TaxID=37863 RepID=A0A1I7XVY8_9BILA
MAGRGQQGRPRKVAKKARSPPVEPSQEPRQEASQGVDFEPDTSSSYADVPAAKQLICIDVAEDLEKRQEKLSQDTRWLAGALKAAVSSILYNREIFFRDMFEDAPLKKSAKPNSPATKTIAIKMLKKNHPANVKILKILHDLTKPMDAKKLQGVDFGVVTDPKNPQSVVYEIYRFKFYYGAVNPSFEIRSASNKVMARCERSTDEEIGYGLSLLLRSLSKAMGKLEKLPHLAGLSAHAIVADNFPLNRKRFHHSLPTKDYQFVDYGGRPPKKMRADGYQDACNGMDITLESVMVKDEYTIMNTTAMDGSIEHMAEQEVPREDSHQDQNISIIATNVQGLHIGDNPEETPRRATIYGTSILVEEDQPFASPGHALHMDTPARSPLSSAL